MTQPHLGGKSRTNVDGGDAHAFLQDTVAREFFRRAKRLYLKSLKFAFAREKSV